MIISGLGGQETNKHPPPTVKVIKAGIDAEAMEKCSLVACLFLLAQAAFLLAHCVTISRVVRPTVIDPTSVIGQ